MDAIGPWKVDKSSLLSLNDCFEDQKTIYLQTIFLNQNDKKKMDHSYSLFHWKYPKRNINPLKTVFFLIKMNQKKTTNIKGVI